MASFFRSATTLIFDCDGVILNSNQIKTEAFRKIASQYGDSAADALVRYHLDHGGISRYKKFEYLFSTILGCSFESERVACLAAEYSAIVYSDLLQCEVTEGLYELREKTFHLGWMIVSGGDEAELRSVMKKRGLDKLFDKGIFGSPASKDENFARQLQIGNLVAESIYIGDSLYDHQAASRVGMPFIFASDWTEFHEWKTYCTTHEIPVISRPYHLMNHT